MSPSTLIPQPPIVPPASFADGRESDPAAQRLRQLNQIGLALSAERDIQRLLELILTKSRELTRADAGSLYLIQKENDPTTPEEQTLYFRLAQNDSNPNLNTSMTFAVGPSSLAGYAALTGQLLSFDDVYELPSDAPYQFNRSLDKKTGYRTKSMVVVPLKSHSNAVIGVLQLINRKRQQDVLLEDEETVDSEVLPFDQELTELAASLASQAAVALENNILLKEIENLFDKFVMASSSAIEDRDPSTSGHSARVTILTVGLAEAASEATEGPFKDVHFTPDQIKELRYASLLHDFGKIGVRENILTKSHKLEPWRFQVVEDRLLLLRRSLETQYANRKVTALMEYPREQALDIVEDLDIQLKAQLESLDSDLALLIRANDPSATFLPDEEYGRQQEVLQKLSRLTYVDKNGHEQQLLTEEEIRALSVRKGSLTPDEYAQIQEHAALSFQFLIQIPWTAEFANIPNIAHCHHEKLNGKGYPRGITAPDIPLQSRMMTVSDMYDALTAADRPYKKAMPVNKALQILEWEARDGGLDRDVLDLFVNQKIYRLTEGWHSSCLPNS
ncbi:MAG: GAF domain-containing protein [Abitibacteriaceae bacterium]|nr:GAF domain-containing protein [Abditibacteriaceae bacterium]